MCLGEGFRRCRDGPACIWRVLCRLTPRTFAVWWLRLGVASGKTAQVMTAFVAIVVTCTTIMMTFSHCLRAQMLQQCTAALEACPQSLGFLDVSDRQSPWVYDTNEASAMDVDDGTITVSIKLRECECQACPNSTNRTWPCMVDGEPRGYFALYASTTTLNSGMMHDATEEEKLAAEGAATRRAMEDLQTKLKARSKQKYRDCFSQEPPVTTSIEMEDCECKEQVGGGSSKRQLGSSNGTSAAAPLFASTFKAASSSKSMDQARVMQGTYMNKYMIPRSKKAQNKTMAFNATGQTCPFAGTCQDAAHAAERALLEGICRCISPQPVYLDEIVSIAHQSNSLSLPSTLCDP